MNPDSFAPFFEDLFKSIEIITDRMDILSNRNNTNQSILTELKLNNSHLLMDKEKLMEEQDETRRNLEKL